QTEVGEPGVLENSVEQLSAGLQPVKKKQRLVAATLAQSAGDRDQDVVKFYFYTVYQLLTGHWSHHYARERRNGKAPTFPKVISRPPLLPRKVLSTHT